MTILRDVALVGVLACLAAAAPAAAATFTVNSTGDGGDSNTADGVCDDGTAICGGGSAACCTLRAAITQSNATTGQDTIEFDIPPFDSTPKTIAPGSQLPDITDSAGVVIDGYTQDDAAPNSSSDATNAVLRIVLDGASTIADGLRVVGGSTTIRGLVIQRFTADGIELNTGDDNVIEGNFIGTDSTGTVDMGNRQGISIANTADDSVGNVIGGTTTGARNLISGNTDGIESNPNFTPCSGRTVVTVQGNLIGTKANGTSALGNTNGVLANGNCTRIGGTAAGARNVISGNSVGISLFASDFHLVEGNYIGTDRTGELDLGNGTGIGFSLGANGNTIGGSSADARNVISGNTNNAIAFNHGGSTGNFIYGNYLGTDKDGEAAIGNGGSGVSSNQAGNNTIGGPGAGEGNVISGNTRGVSLGGAGAAGNVLQGNLIGVGADGATAIGNSLEGVFLFAGAHDNVVGGQGAGEGNVIARNGQQGIDMDNTTGGVGNVLSGNSIHSNNGIGIDIGADGVSANDAADVDTGTNDVQNHPDLDVAVTDGAQIGVDGALHSAAGATYTLEFFASASCDGTGYGEGTTFLGADDVTTDGLGDATFSFVYAAAVPAGHFLTATATAANGSTSEFSACIAVGLLVCGNGVVELSEECDDGNVIAGDCCAPDCTLDVAGSSCAGDGNDCTDDECDGLGTCTHGFTAAGTTCGGDGNVCTDDECDGAGTCQHPDNTRPCFDFVFCNGADTCSGGTCSVHAGDPCAGGSECANTCDEGANTCTDPAGVACTNDGNPCTDDACDGSGACVHLNNTAPCFDSVFCNGADTCSGGTCSVHAGDPCAGGSECANTCDEGANTCTDPAGVACAGDGNPCTDDHCDGSGACVHPANTAPCDDANACTTGDACADGACVPGAPLDCDDGRVCTVDSCDSGLGCRNVGAPRDSADCLVALASQLQVKRSDDPAKNRISWKWSGGDAFDQAMLGSPDVSDAYVLCLYDTTGSVPELVAEETVAPGALWISKAPKGWLYVDKLASSDGVKKIKLVTGADTRTKAQLKAAGAGIEMPVPEGAKYFAADPKVVAQLLNDAGLCWTTEFSAPLKNDADRFKAKTP